MKTLLTILILTLIPLSAQAATYYMRNDGTAANKAAATGCGAVGTAMDESVHNAETFSAGDTIYWCDASTQGGAFDSTIKPPSGGSSGNPVTYGPAPGANAKLTPTSGASPVDVLIIDEEKYISILCDNRVVMTLPAESNSHGIDNYNFNDLDIGDYLIVDSCEITGTPTESGTHTGSNNQATVMTDSTQSFTVDALIGEFIHNTTDESNAQITDNTATTVTADNTDCTGNGFVGAVAVGCCTGSGTGNCELTGGTDNDWDTDDAWGIMTHNSNYAIRSTNDNWQFTNNYIHDWLNIGIKIYHDVDTSTKVGLIQGNTITNMNGNNHNLADCINFDSAAPKTAGKGISDYGGVVIKYNELSECYDDGIDMFGGMNITFEYNEVGPISHATEGDCNGIKGGGRGDSGFEIDGVSTGAGGTFTITGNGDKSSIFPDAETFLVFGSTGNDGEWTVASTSYVDPDLTITVTGNITDGTADGEAGYQHAGNNIIRYNLIHGFRGIQAGGTCNNNGIAGNYGKNNEYYGNVAYDMDGSGIRQKADNHKVYNNYSEADFHGFEADNADGTASYIHNNIFDGDVADLNVSDSSNTEDFYGGYNILVNDAAALDNSSCGGPCYQGDANDMGATNPQQNADYTLKAISPAIDAGTYTASYDYCLKSTSDVTDWVNTVEVQACAGADGLCDIGPFCFPKWGGE